MKQVKKNSAHHKPQQKYFYYLKNIKIGDTVYPSYNGKGCRATACKVINIKDNNLIIEGKLWASENKVIISSFSIDTDIGWVVYEEGIPTLGDYLYNKKEDEGPGDYYRLLLPENFTSDVFETEYLLELGFIDVY